MKQVTLLDRSELRRLPTVNLEKTLHAAENERKYAETVMNSPVTGSKMSDGGIERLYRRIKALDTYMKNIGNEINERDDDAHES